MTGGRRRAIMAYRLALAAFLAVAVRVPAATPAALRTHPAIRLLDQWGKVIDPRHGLRPSSPVSLTRTCAPCHPCGGFCRAYHFQTGWASRSTSPIVLDGLFVGYARGMVGGWRPGLPDYVSLDARPREAAGHLTRQDFLTGSGGGRAPCATCHAGAVPFEDLPFPTSGAVIEPDCLVCHLVGYDLTRRAEQLQAQAFEWIAAAQLGRVTPALFSLAGTRVEYDRKLFQSDGRAALNLQAMLPANCLLCHTSRDVRFRGYASADEILPDVHSRGGMACVTCHSTRRVGGSGIAPWESDHQFARTGRNSPNALAWLSPPGRPSCRECHGSGEAGAPPIRHPGLPAFHLELIACEACHIPHRVRGEPDIFAAEPEVRWVENTSSGAPASPRPHDLAWHEGQIAPVLRFVGAWWGFRHRPSGVIIPVTSSEIGAALERAQVNAGPVGSGPAVYTRGHIARMLGALGAGEQPTRPRAEWEPVYVKGRRVFALAEGARDRLVVSPNPYWDRQVFVASHNVAPAAEALGGRGCTDCHALGASFFHRRQLVDPADFVGQLRYETAWQALGYGRAVTWLSELRQQCAWPAALFLAAWLIAVAVGQRLVRLFRGVRAEPASRPLPTFTTTERFAHVLLAAGFLLTLATGLGYLLAPRARVWAAVLTGDPARALHLAGGGLLVVAGLLSLTVWGRRAVLVRGEWRQGWGLRGYLDSSEPSAGAFSAPQKARYWVLLALTLALAISGIVMLQPDLANRDGVRLAYIVHEVAGLVALNWLVVHLCVVFIVRPRAWRRLLPPR